MNLYQLLRLSKNFNTFRTNLNNNRVFAYKLRFSNKHLNRFVFYIPLFISFVLSQCLSSTINILKCFLQELLTICQSIVVLYKFVGFNENSNLLQFVVDCVTSAATTNSTTTTTPCDADNFINLQQQQQPQQQPQQPQQEQQQQPQNNYARPWLDETDEGIVPDLPNNNCNNNNHHNHNNGGAAANDEQYNVESNPTFNLNARMQI